MKRNNAHPDIVTFVGQCKELDHQGIYELFEDSITAELRNKIYAYSDPSSPEPCRDALVKLGKKFNVKSLITY